MDINHIWSFGREQFQEYNAKGTMTALGLLSLVALLYLFYNGEKGKEPRREYRAALGLTWAGVIIYVPLLIPGLNAWLAERISGADLQSAYRMIPGVVYVTLAAVMLIRRCGIRGESQKKRVGLAAFLIFLIVFNFTSPWKYTGDNYHLLSDASKVSRDAVEAAEIIGTDRALLPSRLAGQINEVSWDVTSVAAPGTLANESDPDYLASEASRQYCRYLVIDKEQLTEAALDGADSTVDAYYYEPYDETERYRYYKKKPTWVLTQYADTTGNQAMFYTFYNPYNGTLIVIDGGWSGNADQVRNVILGYGGVVDAWIVTHYHEDHCGAFNEIYGDPQGIEIRDVYVSSLDKDVFDEVKNDWDTPETFERFLTQTKGDKRIHYPERGDEISVGRDDEAKLDIKFFNTYDDFLVEMVKGQDYPNNCSLVFTVSGVNDKMLFMGDFYNPEMGEYWIDTYGTEMYAKYLQAPYHGNSIMPDTFYEKQGAITIFFDAPESLMRNEDLRAKDLKAWCDANGVETYDYRTAPNECEFY